MVKKTEERIGEKGISKRRNSARSGVFDDRLSHILNDLLLYS